MLLVCLVVLLEVPVISALSVSSRREGGVGNDTITHFLWVIKKNIYWL